MTLKRYKPLAMLISIEQPLIFPNKLLLCFSCT